jgi:hypothetical protein
VNCNIREMTIADYDEVFRLWEMTEGVGISDDDTPDRIALYLNLRSGARPTIPLTPGLW